MRLASMAGVAGVFIGLATSSISARAGAAPVAPVASARVGAAQRVIAQARAHSLDGAVAWHRLLLHDGSQSQADGDGFFLAEDGREDPAAELDATLAAFFAPVVAGREDTHALCRFPARRLWLQQVLRFESALGAAVRCPALDRFVEENDATSVALVYASNYLENPSSAFGHTFLRLHRHAAGGSANTDAVDRGIDYTAATDTRNPLLYAFKGLTGMFAGRFRFSSYEMMLREYAIADARDVWEYELTLTAEETRLLVLHLWELSNATIDYHYITENCSYRLVAALDAAAPRLDLVDGLGSGVMPLDTIDTVMATPGLVRRVVYRPSVRSTLRGALAALSDDQRHLVRRLVDDPEAVLPASLAPEEQARILDAAVRVVDAQHASAILEGDEHDALAARRRLAQRRDALDPRSAADAEAQGGLVAPPSTPIDKAPHRSHAPLRVTVGTGASTAHGTTYGTLGARMALHDLADPPDGVPELNQLQFLDTHLRYDWTRRELTVDSITFAELMTINPLTEFEERLSWRLRAHGMRLYDDGCFDCFAHGLDGSLGVAIATEDEQAALFLMADAYVVLSSRLDGLGGSFVRVGGGPFGGLRIRLPSVTVGDTLGDTVGLLTGTWSYLPAQHPESTFDVRAVLRTQLAKDVAMGLEGAAQPRSLEAQLSSYIYF